MATPAATLPGRISAFVRWVVRTPWPLFSLSMLQADIIGALFVLGFLRYGLPPQDRIQLQDLPTLNLVIFAISLIVVFLAGIAVNLKTADAGFPLAAPRQPARRGRSGRHRTGPQPRVAHALSTAR